MSTRFLRSRQHLVVAVVFFSLFATACTGSRTVADMDRTGHVQHVVLCWLKTPGDAEAIAAIAEASEALMSIPGVLRVETGTALASERSVVDDSFDIGIVFTLESAEALQGYLVHPDHVAASRDVLGPLVERVVIYDIERTY